MREKLREMKMKMMRRKRGRVKERKKGKEKRNLLTVHGGFPSGWGVISRGGVRKERKKEEEEKSKEEEKSRGEEEKRKEAEEKSREAEEKNKELEIERDQAHEKNKELQGDVDSTGSFSPFTGLAHFYDRRFHPIKRTVGSNSTPNVNKGKRTAAQLEKKALEYTI